MRLIANAIILLFVVWTASVSIAAFLDITIYFPWVISSIEEIPLHRLQAIRISIFLTFSHYVVLHIVRINREQAPIDFVIKYLFISIWQAELSFIKVMSQSKSMLFYRYLYSSGFCPSSLQDHLIVAISKINNTHKYSSVADSIYNMHTPPVAHACRVGVVDVQSLSVYS